MAKGLLALQLYATKYHKRKELEDQVEKLKAECAALMPEVLRYFEKTGTDRQSIAGFTLAPRYELWAGREEEISQEQMHDALIKAGLNDYATENMNHQGMSAHIREIWRELVAAEQEKPKDEQRDIGIPTLLSELWARYPELEGKLAIREDLKISVTRSKVSAARERIAGVMERRAQRLPKEVEEDSIPY